MGLDGAYIQTAGISPSLARSCGFPSPALLLSSPSSPQGCTIAEILPFSLEIGTVGFYSRLSTYVSGQKALWQSHKGRSSSHQKTLVIMSQDMAGATAVHMRDILCLWCCVASSVTGGTQRHQGGALSIRQMQGGWYRQRHLDGL